MNRQEIEEQVRRVLAEQLACDASELTPQANFDKDLGADSLDMVEAVLALEEELGISIPEEEIRKIETVGQAFDLVSEKLGAGV